MTHALRNLTFFARVILISVQSYFKPELMSLAAAHFGAWPAAPYWALRVALFGIFAYSVFNYQPVANEVPTRPTDPFEKERALRDPLLGLRALACANVLFGHWLLVVFPPASASVEYIETVLRRLIALSPWCGVWMFFSLSGYLIGKGFVTGRHHLNRDGLRRFYRNRILRIFPIYFIAVFIVATLVSPAALDIRTQASRDTILSTVLFDVTAGGVIGALWSISTEFQFYLISPLIFLALRSRLDSPRQLAGLGLVLCVMFGLAKLWTLSAHPELWHNRIYFPLLSNLDCFVLGMMTAILIQIGHRKGVTFRYGLLLGISLAAASQILFSLWPFSTPYLAFGPGVTALLTCAVIGLFELSERSDANWLSRPLWRLSTFGGAITYCVYVFHEPILISLRRLYPPTIGLLDSLKALSLGVVIVVAFAYLFYSFVESRFDAKRT